MFHPTAYQGTLEENYETVLLQLKGLTYEESDLIANLSNASALLNQFLERSFNHGRLPDGNSCGIYIPMYDWFHQSQLGIISLHSFSLFYY